MKLSIIMPVYNERYTIRECINRVLNAELPENTTRELIIVDDHSDDGTWEIIQDLAKLHDNITILRQEKNQGKGTAIKRAVDEISGDIVIIQDADLEYSPDEYKKLIRPILNGDADVVYGSRFGFSEMRRILYFKHALGNKLLTFLSNWFTDLNLTDIETCYKAFRASILKSIPIRSKRFGFEPEITAKIAKRNLRIFEVPISYFGRTYREGKKITWRDGFAAIWVIVKFWFIDDLYRDEDKTILLAMSNTRHFNKWLASLLRPYLGDKILEVGAGMGTMTLEFLPREHYTCLEIDPLHIITLENMFMNKSNVDVLELNIEDTKKVKTLNKSYDTMLCLNVLEHLQDDYEALKNMNELLTEGGRLVLVVPNCPKLYNSLDRALGHIKRYKVKDIENLLTSFGYKIIWLKTFNKVSILGWFLNGNLLKRTHFSKIQLKIYDCFVWLWRLVDPFLPWPGQSIIAVGEKSANKEGATE
ncbi:MAG: glycosyltransferase [Deltaproteobacteria bacterium]|nr:glycosyltransferase [Deltaproteobacteria bacterium]